jgi:hypothetical protein
MRQRGTLSVGISGHRPNRMAIGVKRVSRRLEIVLDALKRGADGGTRVAVTALAEGSDRLFADAALRQGYRLKVLLPFKSGDYETTFGDKAETATYRQLLSRAHDMTELPGSLGDTKSAYEVVGRATVDASDILVAVWDGKPAAGRGGTPEIIEYAITCRTPVIWIDAARDRLPVLISAPRNSLNGLASLNSLASRGARLTVSQVERLAHEVSGAAVA